jgi:hypothetical protein
VGLISRTVTGRVVEELAVRLAGSTDHAVDEVVRRRSDAIRTAVEVVRLQHPDATPSDVARILVYQRSKLAAIVGGVSALPGAFPGAGSTVEIGWSLADVVALVYSQVVLVMAVAAAFDHDLDAHGARAADVRVVLALDAGVARFGKHGPELADGKRLDPRDSSLSADLNLELGALVIRRTARRRMRTLLGREIPFGIGVAFGAGANFKVMRHTGRTALRYYEFTANGTVRA